MDVYKTHRRYRHTSKTARVFDLPRICVFQLVSIANPKCSLNACQLKSRYLAQTHIAMGHGRKYTSALSNMSFWAGPRKGRSATVV